MQVLKEAGNDRFEQRRHSEAVARNQKEADFTAERRCTSDVGSTLLQLGLGMAEAGQ